MELDVGFYILLTILILGLPLNLVSYMHLHSSKRTNNGLRRGSVGTACGMYQRHYILLLKHLNLCDLLVMVWYIPTHLYLRIGVRTHGWPNGVLGSLLCRSIPFWNLIAFHGSSNIMVAIALIRAIGAKAPKLTCDVTRFNKCVYTMVALTWLFTIVFASPQLFLVKLITDVIPLHYLYDNTTNITTQAVHQVSYCVNVWLEIRMHRNQTQPLLSEKLYYFFHVGTIFWLPSLVVVCAYVLTFASLRKKILQKEASIQRLKSFRPRLTEQSLSVGQVGSPDLNPSSRFPNGRSRTQSRSSSFCARVAPFYRCCTLKWVRSWHTTSVLIVVHLACWTPYNIILLVGENHFTSRILYYLHYLMAVNSVLNPLCYKTSTISSNTPKRTRKRSAAEMRWSHTSNTLDVDTTFQPDYAYDPLSMSEEPRKRNLHHTNFVAFKDAPLLFRDDETPQEDVGLCAIPNGKTSRATIESPALGAPTTVNMLAEPEHTLDI